MKLAAVDPPANGPAANANMWGGFFDAVQARKLGNGVHGFGSRLRVGEGDGRGRIAAMAAWRPSRHARASRDSCFLGSGHGMAHGRARPLALVARGGGGRRDSRLVCGLGSMPAVWRHDLGDRSFEV